MKDEISFMTGMFASGTAKQDKSDDRILGEDLAKWMINKSKGGEFTFSLPIQGKTGWTEAVRAEGREFRLGFEIVHSTVGSDYAEWRIKIDSPKWGLAAAKSGDVRNRLCDHVHNLLRDEYSFREVQWCD